MCLLAGAVITYSYDFLLAWGSSDKSVHIYFNRFGEANAELVLLFFTVVLGSWFFVSELKRLSKEVWSSG